MSLLASDGPNPLADQQNMKVVTAPRARWVSASRHHSLTPLARWQTTLPNTPSATAWPNPPRSAWQDGGYTFVANRGIIRLQDIC